MQDNTDTLAGKTAFVTGAARRIGATIARSLHAHGMNLVLHYHRSEAEARALRDALNGLRKDSAALVQADLRETAALAAAVDQAAAHWGRLDVLVNNASNFYPTPMGTVSEAHWDDLLSANLKAPFFLSQAAAPHLKTQRGCIVNIVDIHGERPLKNHPVYSIAKAGLAMQTRALARELGPEVRVNAVAPGAILWPERALDEDAKRRIIERTVLKRCGDPLDVARAVVFLVEAGYVTGQVITVDGGRMLKP